MLKYISQLIIATTIALLAFLFFYESSKTSPYKTTTIEVESTKKEIVSVTLSSSSEHNDLNLKATGLVNEKVVLENDQSIDVTNVGEKISVEDFYLGIVADDSEVNHVGEVISVGQVPVEKHIEPINIGPTISAMTIPEESGIVVHKGSYINVEEYLLKKNSVVEGRTISLGKLKSVGEYLENRRKTQQ